MVVLGCVVWCDGCGFVCCGWVWCVVGDDVDCCVVGGYYYVCVLLWVVVWVCG